MWPGWWPAGYRTPGSARSQSESSVSARISYSGRDSELACGRGSVHEAQHSTSFRNSTCARWTDGEEKPPEAATDGTAKHLLKDIGPSDADSQ